MRGTLRFSRQPCTDRRINLVSKPRKLAAEVLHGISVAPTSASEAFEILTTVSARLRAHGDFRAVFPDVYAVVTRRVRDSLQGQAKRLFIEPSFISRLAGRFCELYLAALRHSLEDEPQRCTAWGIADREASSPSLYPAQHALLGLNAHINFDLALGLFANVTALGGAGDAAKMARYRHDHDAVNEILEEALPEVMSLLADRYACKFARLVLRLGEPRRALYWITLLTLTAWRSRVWGDLVSLLAAPDAVERTRIEARMSLRSGAFARMIALRAPFRSRAPARTLAQAA